MAAIKIQPYTERSYVILGDTKAYKDVLKGLGCKWNSKLKCGKGWIVGKSKITKVQEWYDNLPLSKLMDAKVEPKVEPDAYTGFNRYWKGGKDGVSELDLLYGRIEFLEDVLKTYEPKVEPKNTTTTELDGLLDLLSDIKLE